MTNSAFHKLVDTVLCTEDVGLFRAFSILSLLLLFGFLGLLLLSGKLGVRLQFLFSLAALFFLDCAAFLSCFGSLFNLLRSLLTLGLEKEVYDGRLEHRVTQDASRSRLGTARERRVVFVHRCDLV
jgi:hypothetical protein